MAREARRLDRTERVSPADILMRILLVEDDSRIAKFVAGAFENGPMLWMLQSTEMVPSTLRSIRTVKQQHEPAGASG
jgi:hypothetical protein